MTDQITLEEALQLVTFNKESAGKWRVGNVHGIVGGNVLGSVWGNVGGNVLGSVWGNVGGNVRGNVFGNVGGDVCGDVEGNVLGRISGKEWKFVETPREKLARLIKESGNAKLIEAFNELEDLV